MSSPMHFSSEHSKSKSVYKKIYTFFPIFKMWEFTVSNEDIGNLLVVFWIGPSALIFQDLNKNYLFLIIFLTFLENILFTFSPKKTLSLAVLLILSDANLLLIKTFAKLSLKTCKIL